MAKPIDLVYNNIILMIVFFIIYSTLYYFNNDNFNNVTSYFDIFYFTTTTQSSTGYGDIVPKTKLAKMFTSLHHILILFIFAEYVYEITR